MKVPKSTRKAGLAVLLVMFLQPMLLAQENETFSTIKTLFESYLEQAPGERLYLHIDKSLYQPGETVWFTAYLRNDGDLRKSDQSDMVNVEMFDPKGNLVRSLTLVAKNGVASGDIEFSTDQAGGIYKLKAFTEWQKNDIEPFVFEKDLQLQKLILPRLLMTLEFPEKGYGPGDEVKAEFTMKNLENQPIADHNLSWDVYIKGEKVETGESKTRKDGTTEVELFLPEDLETTDGLLNVQIDYDGIIESVSRAIPITLNKIELEFYPEGGDLVVGHKTRIAFQALNEYGKPTDIEGKIVDKEGVELVSFSSFRKGMGAFYFKPQPGGEYFASITRPEGISEVYKLPSALKKGYTLNVNRSGENFLQVSVRSDIEEEVFIAAQVRGVIHHSQSFPVKKGLNKFRIDVSGFPAGVAQLTLFDNKGIPRAERLAFVNKDNQLKIKIETDKEVYQPREKVEVELTVVDENDMPVTGSFSMAVVDEKLVKMANDKSGKILSKLLLEPDISGDIDEPSFYFDPDEPDADLALDMLLMTKGWRRFAWKELLSKKEPFLAHLPVKAVIKGYIYNQKEKHPVKNLKVTLLERDISVKTDGNGFFRFEGIDLTEKVTLEYKDRERVKQSYTVAEYQNNLMIDVSKKYVFSENWEDGMNGSRPSNYYVSSGTSSIKGQIFDTETKEPIAFANIIAEVDGRIVSGAVSDLDGNYQIKPISSGKYDIKTSYVGYQSHIIQGVVVKSRQILFLDLEMSTNMAVIEAITSNVVEKQEGDAGDKKKLVNKSSGLTSISLGKGYYTPPEISLTEQTFAKREVVNTSGDVAIAGVDLDEIVISAYKVPLIDADQTISGAWITEDDLDNMPMRDTESIATAVGGVFSMDGERGSIRGARSDQTVVYIDGVRVIGSSALPRSAIAEVSVYLSGVPAEYGDFRGGVIDITTKSAASNFSYTPRKNKAEEIVSIPMGPVYHIAREFPEVVYEKTEEVLERNDFRTTVFWNGNVELNDKGTASVAFHNSDALTTFNITVEGVSDYGMVGRAVENYITKVAFSIDAKVPNAVLMGDKVKVPVYLKNTTSQEIKGDLSFMFPEGWKPVSDLPAKASIAANSTKVVYVEMDILNTPGKGDLKIGFKNESGVEDNFETKTAILPRGFPVENSWSGYEKDNTFYVDIFNPIEGSVQGVFNAYPSNLSTLMAGIEGMLRQPHGCFEQVSSSTYPNLLVLDFLNKSGYENKEISEKALGYIKSGYKKLAGYECSTGGFEWYGADPAHEGLTAYGLMEFIDMQKVYKGVSQSMINRTRNWLLDKRKGNGEFKVIDMAKFHRWGTQDVLVAYMIWALTEAGETELENELNLAIHKAETRKDPYQLALLANASYNMHKRPVGNELIQTLVKLKRKNSSWTGATRSVTNSSGKSLEVETTALCILAMLKAGNEYQEIQPSVSYLLKQRRGIGSFGSTQATVLALKAITEFYRLYEQQSGEGEILISVNDEPVHTYFITGKEMETITIEEISDYLIPGNNKIRIEYTGMENPVPFTFNTKWTSDLPVVENKSVLSFTTSLTEQNPELGENSRLKVEISNNSEKAVPFPIAIVGIPAGLSLQPWQLKEYSEKGDVFAYYEIMGNDIVLYFRELDAKETRTINLDLKTDIPGSFESSASVAYLYYEDEDKYWSAGERVVIEE